MAAHVQWGNSRRETHALSAISLALTLRALMVVSRPSFTAAFSGSSFNSNISIVSILVYFTLTFLLETGGIDKFCMIGPVSIWLDCCFLLNFKKRKMITPTIAIKIRRVITIPAIPLEDIEELLEVLVVLHWPLEGSQTEFEQILD